MAQQQTQFRPGGPGPQGPGGPGAPGAPGGRPSAPGPMMGPGGQHNVPPPGYPGSRQSSFDPNQAMGSPPGDNTSKKGKKGKKGKNRDDDSDSEEDECKCPPQQPSTQIFICPPSCQPQGMGMGMGGMGGMGMGMDCGGGAGGMMSQQNSGCIDPAKLCQIQCYGGDKSKDTQAQVICCPPSSCGGCQRKGQRQDKSQGKCVCQSCGQECPPKKGKKAQGGSVEGMMPASQQFLMFLQAYGLAAALIRDRNRREDERQQKEFEEKQRKGSQSKDRKGSAKDKDRKGSAKDKDKGKDKDKKEKKK